MNTISVVRSMLLVVIPTLLAGCSPSSNQNSADTELLSVVAISRHGIRSPEDLSQYTSRPEGFPKWPASVVDPKDPEKIGPDVAGNLSIFGKQNVTRLGAWYRDYYTAQGLLPAIGSCPEPETVFVYADVLERTIQTAQGYVNGMFQSDETPGCGVTVMSSSEKADPYIVPFLNATGECQVETGADYDVFMARIGSAASLINTYSAQLQTLQAVTQSPSPLLDLPTSISQDFYVRFDSGTLFDVADTLTETFEIEYAQGMPVTNCATTLGAECVGWGAIPAGGLNDLMKLHVLNMGLTCGLPSFAQVLSTNLMSQLTGTMDQTLSGVKDPNVLAPLASKFSLFVAHDENLLAIASFLGGVTWKAEGFQQNDPGPAGALVFELHKVKQSGQLIVRLFYVIASLDQMRQGTTLSLTTPPQRIPLAIPACDGSYDCPYDQFKAFITTHVSQDCLITAPPAP